MMSIYERITDKMAEKWLYLEENTHFRYKAAVRVLKCAKSVMDGKTHATGITLIIAVLMLFGAYMADNPRWFSIPGLDQGQHIILYIGAVVYFSVVMFINLISKIIYDSACKFVNNNPCIFDKFT